MNKIRVGVLRGGPSSEYDISLKTGASILRNIPNIAGDIYEAHDIFISKNGVWHRSGIPIEPHVALSHVDVIFNALHGQYGEDGKVQNILETHGIPFTGSGSFSSALGMNKAMSKEIFKRENIRTPQYRLVTEIRPEELMNLFRTFSPPLVVKPVSAGSSIGVSLVKTFSSFEEALRSALKHSDTAMVEEYIPGVEATVGVIEGYRDRDIYALPAIYSGTSDKISAQNFSHEEKKKIEEIAIKVHNILECRHYSNIDFIISPRRGPFALEVNTLPGLTAESIFPRALNSVGSSLPLFIDHLLQLALADK